MDVQRATRSCSPQRSSPKHLAASRRVISLWRRCRFPAPQGPSLPGHSRRGGRRAGGDIPSSRGLLPTSASRARTALATPSSTAESYTRMLASAIFCVRRGERGFGRMAAHAATFRRFFASMARTNLSHFAMPTRFSTIYCQRS